MNPNTIQVWVNHENLSARNKERERYRAFFLCAIIFLAIGVVGLNILVRL